MATPEPPGDPFNPILQALRDRVEQEAFPEGGFDDCLEKIGPLYNEERQRPYVCALMTDVLSGRWQLGATHEEVSRWLGIWSDRTWVSHAMHRGRLSLSIYLRPRCWPGRPDDWEPDIQLLQDDMERSASIGMAKFRAERLPPRLALPAHDFHELAYELVCELLARLADWLPQHVARNALMALELVRNVCLAPRRNVVPAWYTTRQQRQVATEIHRLTSDAAAAFEYLDWLQRNWLDIVVGSCVLLEDMRCS